MARMYLASVKFVLILNFLLLFESNHISMYFCTLLWPHPFTLREDTPVLTVSSVPVAIHEPPGAVTHGSKAEAEDCDVHVRRRCAPRR